MCDRSPRRRQASRTREETAGFVAACILFSSPSNVNGGDAGTKGGTNMKLGLRTSAIALILASLATILGGCVARAGVRPAPARVIVR